MRPVVIALAAGLACGIPGAPAADAPTPAAELRVLEDMIGTWDEVVTVKPAEWTPASETRTSVTRRSWSLGGKLMRSDGTWQPTKTEFLYLVAYDAAARVYRCWYFDTTGEMPREPMTGTWDAESRTLTWTVTDGAGNQTVAKHKIIDKDRHDWTMVVTNRDRKVVLDFSAKCTRRKM
jgi:Protein of unknown function (DUF1579)